MITFTAAVRKRISEEYRKEAFTFANFADVALAYGKPIKSVTHVLRDMMKMGFLVVASVTKPRSGGGLPTKIYKVPHGIKIEVVPPKGKKEQREDWKRGMEAKERNMHECAKRLSDAMDGMR